MDLVEERKRVGDAWRVFRSTNASKGPFEYRKPGGDARKTWNAPATCAEYEEQDRFHGLYRAPTFFRGTVEDYITVVEDYPDAHELRAKLRADVDDDVTLGSDAVLLAQARVRMYHREQADATTPSGRKAAEDNAGVWQHESQRALVSAQQRFVLREQDKAGPRWQVRYNTEAWTHDKAHRAIYRDLSTGEDQHDPPSTIDRYIMAVEDTTPSLDREHELDAARSHVLVRTCIDTARSRRQDFPGWELELRFLYHKVVTDQGTDYTAAGCQLVATTRYVYGLELAIQVCQTRDNRFDAEWKGELYLALLQHLKGEGSSELDEARADMPRSVALGLAACEDHLGMDRALGTARWTEERDKLQSRLDEPAAEEEEALPHKRRGVRTGAGALPFAPDTSSRTLSLQRLVQSKHEQVPDAAGYVPFRTNAIVMTCVGKGQCVLEAVRFATACRQYSRETFGLPKRGDVNLKELVRGARLNRDFPFTFVKQRPTVWAGLPRLPWGIYMGRVVVGEFSHIIVYDTWRHLLFLGGDRSDRRAAPRGWYVEEEEVQDPAVFEKFMMDMLGPQLQRKVDAIYRIDVHAKRLRDTSYC